MLVNLSLNLVFVLGGILLVDTVFRALILVFAGTFLLRISGRQSISQMTSPQLIVMLSIGAIIIEPINASSVGRTILAVGVFVGALVLMEYLEVKFNFIESFISGKSVIVIENGELKPDALRKLRMTVDQLEMRLRQHAIGSFQDVKIATIEPNGELGYELMRHAKPVTIGELEQLLSKYINPQTQDKNVDPATLFRELQEKHAEDRTYPSNLQ